MPNLSDHKLLGKFSEEELQMQLPKHIKKELGLKAVNKYSIIEAIKQKLLSCGIEATDLHEMNIFLDEMNITVIDI